MNMTDLHQEVSDHGGWHLAQAREDPDCPENEQDAVPEPHYGEGLWHILGHAHKRSL